MALRTPLSVTPHLYMGDSTGRPLDKGVVYFGEQDKDPEFYPINLFSDDALTKPLAQPVHTKGGYLYDKGDMVEPHAKELIYSVKVLDSYGRKVFYKGAMMRNSWNDDVIQQINEAVIGSADVARQVATDITNEAINNTAVEGGVLADTFVTVTSREPNMIARTQRDVNSERVSIKDFGEPVDGDWTDVISLALSYGKPIQFPLGKYKVRKDKIFCGGKDVLFYGDYGAELILIEGSDANYVFDASNSKRVVIKGFNITSSLTTTTNCLFNFSPTSYTKELIFEGNTTEGYVELVYAVGSYEQDPYVTYFGFDYISVQGNTSNNSHYGIFTLGNFPCKLMVVKDNIIRNLGGVYVSLSIGNGSSNGDKLMEINEFVVQNNVLTTDTEYWSTPRGSSTSLFSAEGRKITYQYNSIEGLKSKGKYSLHDAYLASKIVISNNNTVRNIGCFNLEALGHNIFHMKSDAIGNKIPHKEVVNNTFIIDKEWLASIGETDCVYTLFNVGIFNGGDVIIKDCTVKVPTLEGNTRNSVQSFSFIGNTIEADKITVRGSLTAHRFLDIAVVESSNKEKNYMRVNDNNLIFTDAMDTNFNFILNNADSRFSAVEVVRNNLVCNNTTGISWLVNLYSERGVVTDNVVRGRIYREYQVCSIDSLSSYNNTYETEPLEDTDKKLRVFEDPVITHTGQINHHYLLTPYHFRFGVFSSKLTHKQRYIARIILPTADGFDILEIRYVVDSSIATPIIKFTDTSDVEQSLSVADIGTVPMKLDIISDSEVPPTPSVNFLNLSGSPFIQVLGISGKNDIKVELDVFKL